MNTELMVTIIFPVFDLEHGEKLLKVVDGGFSCKNLSISGTGFLHFHKCRNVDGGKNFSTQLIEALQFPVARKFRICDCNSSTPFSGEIHEIHKNYFDFEIWAPDVVNVKIEGDAGYAISRSTSRIRRRTSKR